MRERGEKREKERKKRASPQKANERKKEIRGQREEHQVLSFTPRAGQPGPVLWPALNQCTRANTPALLITRKSVPLADYK